MREIYGNELDELENLLLEEGRFVDRAIRSALNALARDDLELADELVAFDDEIDRRYLAIEQGIPVLLARQTPVAGDLRRVLAILYINVHLERIADYCVTIAKLTKLSHELPRDTAVLEALEEMGERCREMLGTSLDNFHTRDVRNPEALVVMDSPINRANRKLIDRFIAFGEDEPQREWAMRMMLVSRCLERIGDHTVDIGEQTFYLVSGEFEEFTDASHKTTPRPAV
jgi:phosphate transport system protein